MAKNLISCLPALLLACALPLTAQAGETNAAAARQQATAAAHAGMALGAADIKTTHMHLHHVVNCLVGPSGKAFDAKAANPCKDIGHGAIVDAKGDAATEARLHKALSEAEKGLKTSALADAHADAKSAMATLQSH
ncbi:MAG TPA: hypothetical protein VN043_17325 [Rhodanobacter sp.]|nr:hypothetical protein [Rhodanobacter sp.]